MPSVKFCCIFSIGIFSNSSYLGFELARNYSILIIFARNLISISQLSKLLNLLPKTNYLNIPYSEGEPDSKRYLSDGGKSDNKKILNTGVCPHVLKIN